MGIAKKEVAIIAEGSSDSEDVRAWGLGLNVGVSNFKFRV